MLNLSAVNGFARFLPSLRNFGIAINGDAIFGKTFGDQYEKFKYN